MITAVDVGATKTLVAQFGDGKSPINEVRFATPEDPTIFLTELTQHLNKLKGIDFIAIGIPGRTTDGVIGHCPNLPLWKGFELVKDLQEALKCPILVENDANLAGLAEINAISPVPQVGLYLTISTGIGSGLIVEGRIAHQLSRHSFGHMVFNHDGKWQEWEAIASGRSIVAHFGKMAHELSTLQEWQWVAEQIAVGLLAIIHPINPDVIVFGGGVGAYLDRFKTPLLNLLRERLSDPNLCPTLLVAQHPNEAVLYGCYYYATHQQVV